MFEHLDDPRPWEPDRDAIVRRGRQVRRRRRLAAGAAGTLAFVVLAGVAGALYVDRRDDAIERVEVATPTPSLDGAVNVLVVGTDESGGRSDTIAVLRIAPSGPPRVLFVPRDLWDAGAGTRINQASTEGPQATVDAVDRTLGIPIDHYVAIDMAGFADLVDAAGGLELAIGAPVRDVHSGLALGPSSCTSLDGETALALARARHLQVREGGDGWRADPTGDLGRIARGQVIVAAALGELATIGRDPVALDRLSRVLAEHAVLDEALSLGRLVELGRHLAGAGPVVADAVPTEGFMAEGGAAVLRLAPGASAVLAVYGGEPTAEPSPTPGVGALVPIHPC